jgi:hypothetical protein
MANQDCSCCRFFLIGFGDRLGVCRRFPSFQNRSVSEWCGEFSQKMPELVALPVVEMQPKPKRKYTRRKNAETSA